VADAPNLLVAQTDQAELGGEYSDTTIRFCDRSCPIVRTLGGRNEPRVDPRRKRKHRPTVMGFVSRMGNEMRRKQSK
jgi:hypothetical protein